MKRQVWQFLRLFSHRASAQFFDKHQQTLLLLQGYSSSENLKSLQFEIKKKLRWLFLQSRHLNELPLVKIQWGVRSIKRQSLSLKKDLIERFQDSTTHFEKKTCLAGANNPRHTEYIFYASIPAVSTSTYSVLNVACYCLTFKGITKIHSLQLLIL